MILRTTIIRIAIRMTRMTRRDMYLLKEHLAVKAVTSSIPGAPRTDPQGGLEKFQLLLT